MDFKTSATYPAPIDRVKEMLVSEAFQRERLAEIPVKILSVIVQQTDDGRTEIITNVLAKPKELHLPSAADKFIPRSGINVKLTETWNMDTDDGVITVEMGSLPVSVAATSKLIDEGAACKRTFDGKISVSIPFIGKKLEKTAVEALPQIMEDEEAAAKRYLED